MGSNRFRNWRADEVRQFVLEHGFTKASVKGDDEIWMNRDLQGIFRIPFRNEVISLGSMLATVRKSKIGIKSL